MKNLLIDCEGITVGPLLVPRFQLGNEDLLCLHLPGPCFSREEDQLVQALAGKRPVPGLRVCGRVWPAVWTAFPPVSRAGLIGLFHRPRPVDWLCRVSGISREEAAAIVARLGLRPDWRICQLAGDPRALLGLEAAWAGGAEAILFTTAGLDPLGRRAVFQAVRAHVGRCPAIHLSHMYTTQGRWERYCPPGAACLEVTQVLGAPVPLAPAEGRS
jgi:hypothetical protein